MSKQCVIRFVVGRAYQFKYPAHNYIGIPLKLEGRRIRVLSIRDTRRDRLDCDTFEMNPTLKRGRWLITGRDLDRACDRSFYLESMESIGEIREQPEIPSCEFRVWFVGTTVYTSEACALIAAEVDSRLFGAAISVRQATASWVSSREIRRVSVKPENC
jgi:hypothetical protein